MFGTRLQQVEHVAYALMLAARAEVDAPRVVATGVGGADAALLVTSDVCGTPLAGIDAARLDDAALGALWAQTGRLHDAGISHGTLDPQRLLLADDGTVAFGLQRDVGRRRPVLARPRRQPLLVMTSLLVGNERAVAAAIAATDAERVGALIPLIQPASLPPGSGRAEALRQDVEGARPTSRPRPAPRHAAPEGEAPELGEHRHPRRVLFALAIAIPSLEGSTGSRSRANSRMRHGVGRCSRCCSIRWSRCRGPPR